MDLANIIATSLLSAYLFVVLLVGVWYVKRKETSSSWQFGTGGLGVLGIVSVLIGTRLGAASTVGMVENVYKTGIGSYAFILSGFIGFVLMGWTIGRYFYRTKMMTLVAFVNHRFSRRFAFLAVALGLSIGMVVNGIQLLGIALIVKALTGLPLLWGVIIGSALGWTYLTLGGIEATSATNTIHISLCFFAVISGVLIMVTRASFFEAWAAVPAERLSLSGHWNVVVDWMIAGTASHFVSNVYFSPLATANSEEEAVRSAVLSGVIYAVFGLLVTVMGIYALGEFGPLFERVTGSVFRGEEAFGNLTLVLGDPELGGSLFGLIVGTMMMAGVIGAIISTMAPLVWNISTIVSQDVYKGYLRPDATDDEELLVARIFSTIYWLVPAIVALIIKEGLLDTLLFLLELPMGAAIPIILCFYWDRVNEASGFYTMLASATSGLTYQVFLFYYPEWVKGLGPWFGTSPGWITSASFVAFAIAMVLGESPSDEQLEVVRRARQEEDPLPTAPGVKNQQSKASA